jgi:replicative DNA helicase
MGKTCWINELSLHCARQHGEVVINYQCEMAEDEMANMTAANVLMKERNSLTKEDNKKAARLLGEARYYIGRDATLTEPKGVLDLLEKAIRRLGATVVVLDHIHFLCRGDNELRDQAEASKRIKTLAQQYKVKFIVVAQPRKADSKNKGKALHVSDIKGSGAIMDDADALLVLHREYVKNPDPDNPPMDSYEPETEIHCLKARSKGDGAMFAKLMFAGSCATFHEMTPLEPPPLP